MSKAFLSCRVCERTRPLAPVADCPSCGGPLDVGYPAGARLRHDRSTPLVQAERLSDALGIELLLKLENASPTGSFKDRVAASAVAAAEAFGFETVCCASTGNLGRAVAARCAAVGLEAVVLCPAGDLLGSESGGRVIGVGGSFDKCLRLERQLEALFPWGFVGGNLQPLAAEGAKTIAYELAEQLGRRPPDAVVCPVGSGMLLAKLAQGFDELAAVGPRPRLYGAQAGGCPPLAAAWAADRPVSKVRPATAARSLAVGDPAFGELAVGAAHMSGGSIQAIDEDEIDSYTALLAELCGFQADPAAGVALGALLALVRSGEIAPGERAVLVVTGAASTGREVVAEEVDDSVDAVLAALGL